MSGAVSGSQFGVPTPRAVGHSIKDDTSALGDPLGGWKGVTPTAETPDASSAVNLSTSQKPLAWRSPNSAGIGVNTIGTWQGLERSWHERYKD